jgi:hypothetical protein
VAALSAVPEGFATYRRFCRNGVVFVRCGGMHFL